MTSREWQPGDVAMARHGYSDEWLVVRHRGDPDYWSAPGDWPRGASSDQCTYRPLTVIDPEQANLYIARDGDGQPCVWIAKNGCGLPEAKMTEHQAGPVLWAHLKATLPTRDEPQDEPTDPAVRVLDCTGDEWARIGEVWVNTNGGNEMWAALNRHLGPITIRPVNMRSGDPVRPSGGIR